MTAQTSEAAIPARAWLALSVLLLVNVLNFVDRTLPFILIAKIQKDLRLSDTQIGLLGGVVFSLIYAIAGIPLGRLADRVNRRSVLAAATLVWGLMTAAGGFSATFLQLATSRVGLAAAEATAAPFATSMIADLFPSRRRRTALSIYLAGSSIGGLIGLALGGWLGDTRSWRVVFMIFAVPALVTAFLLQFAIREPTRGAYDAPSGVRDGESLGRAILDMLRVPTFRHLAAGACLFIAAAISLFHFSPLYLIRTFGLSSAQVGLGFGIATGVSGLLGTVVGGLATDRLSLRDPRWSMWISAGAILLALPVFLAAWQVRTLWECIGLLTFGMFLNTIYLGPTFAAVQLLAGPARRGLAVAILTFCMYGIGASIGPTVTGMLSDLFRAHFGADGLRYALMLMSVPFVWSAAHFLRAAYTLGKPSTALARTSSARADLV